MTSLVEEILRDVVANKKTVTELLRFAKVIAAKLKLPEVEGWISHELGGYPKGEKIPEYRKASAILQIYYPRLGWRRIDTFSKKISFTQPMPEIETGMVDNESMFHPDEPVRLKKNGLEDINSFPQRFVLSKSAFIAIAEDVRTRILDWAINLERNGIVGEGLRFSETEKASAIQNITIGTLNGILGSAIDSTLRVGDIAVTESRLNRAVATVSAPDWTGKRPLRDWFKIEIRNAGKLSFKRLKIKISTMDANLVIYIGEYEERRGHSIELNAPDYLNPGISVRANVQLDKQVSEISLRVVIDAEDCPMLNGTVTVTMPITGLHDFELAASV